MGAPLAVGRASRLFRRALGAARPRRQRVSRARWRGIRATDSRRHGRRVASGDRHRRRPNYLALLNANSYEKGGYVLTCCIAARRQRVLRGLRAYYAKHRDATALSDDLRAELEQASGRTLGQFFDQWLRRPGVAEPAIGWAYDPSAASVSLFVRQDSARGPYALPLTVVVTMPAGVPHRRPSDVRPEATGDPAAHRRVRAEAEVARLRPGQLTPRPYHAPVGRAPSRPAYSPRLGVAARCLPAAAAAQRALPRVSRRRAARRRALDQAEEVLYAEVRGRPRDPEARARLGRYLAMKGALRPGLVLVDEAVEFGLETATARAVAAPIRALIGWRDASSPARATRRSRCALPRATMRSCDSPSCASVGRHALGGRRPAHDRVDSASRASPIVGIETIDALLPEVDVANGTMRLHADPRAAVVVPGRRYTCFAPRTMCCAARARARPVPPRRAARAHAALVAARPAARRLDRALAPAVRERRASLARSRRARPSGSDPARRRCPRARAARPRRRCGCRAATRPTSASWRGCRRRAAAMSRGRRNTFTMSMSPGTSATVR